MHALLLSPLFSASNIIKCKQVHVAVLEPAEDPSYLGRIQMVAFASCKGVTHFSSEARPHDTILTAIIF